MHEFDLSVKGCMALRRKDIRERRIQAGILLGAQMQHKGGNIQGELLLPQKSCERAAQGMTVDTDGLSPGASASMPWSRKRTSVTTSCLSRSPW